MLDQLQDAPSHRPMSVAEEQQQDDALYERAQDLAADAFESCESAHVTDWLEHPDQREEIMSIVFGYIAGCEGAYEAKERLRDKYVEKHAELYLEDAEDEALRNAEDAWEADR